MQRVVHPGVIPTAPAREWRGSRTRGRARVVVNGQALRGIWAQRSPASQRVVASCGVLAVALLLSQGVLPYVVREVWFEIAGR